MNKMFDLDSDLKSTDRYKALLLLKNGSTQKQVSEVLGVSQTSISRWYRQYVVNGVSSLRLEEKPKYQKQTNVQF